MTAEEKQKACVAEMLASLRTIITDAQTLNTARWVACVALETVRIISEEDRVPTRPETFALMQRFRQGRAATA